MTTTVVYWPKSADASSLCHSQRENLVLRKWSGTHRTERPSGHLAIDSSSLFQVVKGD